MLSSASAAAIDGSDSVPDKVEWLVPISSGTGSE